MNYPEFEGIENMNEEECAEYLLNIVNRYMNVIKEAKIILEERCMPYIESNGTVNGNVRIKSRVVTNIDNNMLCTAFPEIYDELYRNGKLVAKAQDLNDYREELMDTVITTKKSSWLELKEKV